MVKILDFDQKTLGSGLPAWTRYLLAIGIFGAAWGLRFLVLPVEAGLAFLIFYPGTAIVALLCGLGPSLLYILLAAAAGGYVFVPPFWALDSSKIVPTFAFLISASTILLVISFYQRSVARQTKTLTDESSARERLASQLQVSLDHLTEIKSAFRQTFEQAAVGIAHVTPDGRWLRVNQKLCDIVGYPLEELLTKTFQDITHPDDLDADLASLQQVLAGKLGTYAMEKRYLRKDGVVVWINLTVSLVRQANGEPDYFIAVVEDIRQRKAATVALKASETALKEAQRLARVGTWDWQLQGDRHSWSEEIYLIYGRDPTLPPAIFPEVQKYFTPQSWAQLSLAVEQGITAGVPYECDAEVVRPDGSHRWIIARGEAMRDGDGQIISLHGTVQDITERKRTEEEIRHLNTDLERRVSERTMELQRSNQELDDFAYIASHDLKEPLRGLHNYASFLQEDYAASLDDEGKRYLQRMQRLVERLTALIDGLLAYSRLGSIELAMDSVAIDPLLNEVVEDLTPFLQEHGVTLVRATPLPTLQCNALRVREVFQNLIANAAKYNDKTGKQIEVGCSDTKPPIFYVRDNGIGIAPQHQDSIFRIFKRLHEQDKFGGGTGAGLTIVKKIIERHGGRIWLESMPGEGTTFYFQLSAAP